MNEKYPRLYEGIGDHFSNLSNNYNLKTLHLRFSGLKISENMLKNMFINLNSKVESLEFSIIIFIYYENESKDFDSSKLSFLYSLCFLKELSLEYIDNISNKDLFELSHYLISLRSIRIINCDLLISEECLEYFINCEGKSFTI